MWFSFEILWQTVAPGIDGNLVMTIAPEVLVKHRTPHRLFLIFVSREEACSVWDKRNRWEYARAERCRRPTTSYASLLSNQRVKRRQLQQYTQVC